MSAMAGLLGTRLVKPGLYSLGEGMREPNTEDIGTAIRVSERTAILTVFTTIGLLTVRHAIVG